MRKSLLLFIILILLTGCGQTATLSTAQNDKIQTLKDQIAVLKQKQTEQRNSILALKVKLDVYQSHSGIPDFSEFNELYRTNYGTTILDRSEVLYDAQTDQTTIVLRYINASVSFKGSLPQQVKIYDMELGIWFYWVTESNVVQILSYEKFSKAVLDSAGLKGSVSLNDGTVLAKFVPDNGLSGSEKTIVTEFLSRQFVFTVSN
jgi:hypothetical protein